MKKTVSTIITALALVLVPTVFAVGCGEGGSDETETFTVTVVGARFPTAAPPANSRKVRLSR